MCVRLLQNNLLRFVFTHGPQTDHPSGPQLAQSSSVPQRQTEVPPKPLWLWTNPGTGRTVPTMDSYRSCRGWKLKMEHFRWFIAVWMRVAGETTLNYGWHGFSGWINSMVAGWGGSRKACFSLRGQLVAALHQEWLLWDFLWRRHHHSWSSCLHHSSQMSDVMPSNHQLTSTTDQIYRLTSSNYAVMTKTLSKSKLLHR